jgi:hypothetical protein
MKDAASPGCELVERMAGKQDQRISEVVSREGSRLRRFIRRRERWGFDPAAGESKGQ